MGILICGLNGTGKSTLGRILADRLGYEFIDNEDLFFPKTDPSYAFSSPRSKEEVIRLLEEKISENNQFVFAAVKGDYGEKLIAALDCIILVNAPKTARSQRVRERSFHKFGDRILPGGDLYDKESKWFSLTDNRPETYVTDWLGMVDCPVIPIDGTLPVEENVEYIVQQYADVLERKTSMNLLVRKMTDYDLEPLHMLLSNPEVMRFLESPYTMEQTKTFLKAALSENPLVYAAEVNGTFIGYVIYHPYEEDSIEIGWVLLPEYWRHGYASELTRQMIDQASKENKTLVIECDPRQEVTKHIAQKFGFARAGSRDGLDVYRL